VLLASLFVAAAPTSAKDLAYSAEALPSAITLHLAASSNITDFAIANDGVTIYAVGNTGSVWKSSNAGRTWAAQVWAAADAFDMVAVAPDDPNLVAVASSANKTVYVSTLGGMYPSNLALLTFDGAAVIRDLDISPTVLGAHYITAVGNDATGPAYYYFDLGATLPAWRDACATVAFSWTYTYGTAYDSIYSVAYSPNFAADYTALAVTSNLTSGVILNQVNFNTKKWDTFGSEYPVAVYTGNVSAVAKADIAMAPDYIGADEVMRLAFVGLAATANVAGVATEVGGITRFSDFTPGAVLAATAINSVAYDGTNLAAGAYANNTVYRCANPLAVYPTALSARTNKKVGLDDSGAFDQVVVGFIGSDVVAAKQGNASCFSISHDYGMTFNDISLMDSALTNIDDFAVSPDGANLYIVANDAAETSVYRLKAGVWERVLIVATTATDYIARPVADNMDVLYLASDTTIYYTADAGETRWYQRAATGTIADMVVEDASTIYIATGSSVVKSVNGGFVWGPPSTPTTWGGNINSLKALGANMLLAGSNDGKVAYTMDGCATWVYTIVPVTGAGNIVATADGLEAGSNIYAATDASATVYRWTIGTNIVAWDSIGGSANATFVSQDIELVDGVLYRLGAETTANTSLVGRTLSPSFPVPAIAALFWTDILDSANTVPAATYKFNNTPDALKLSASNKLWANDTVSGAIISYTDTLAPPAAAPALNSPANDALMSVNAITGTPNNVTLTWSTTSVATSYELQVAQDAMFVESLLGPVTTGATTVQIIGPNVAGYTIALSPGQTYYWKIRAATPVPSNWSETRSFIIQPGPAMVPTIASPANGGTIDSTAPAFSWGPVAQASLYEFQLAANPTFAAPLISEQLANTGIQPAVTLDRGATYFWRVRAVSPVEGDWSTIANFTVAVEEAPPPKPAPPVKIEAVPDIVIEIPQAPPATVLEIPPAPPVEKIAPAYIWAIIIIGAVLVIAVIVLIVRTRRSV